MWASTSGKLDIIRTQTCFGSDDDIVLKAERHRWTSPTTVSTIKSNVNPKKLPPAIKPHAETFHPQRVRHHYTPGSPTVTVERAGAVVCKRATPHRARRRYPRSATSTRHWTSRQPRWRCRRSAPGPRGTRRFRGVPWT